jgi:hypothetical protein
MRIVLKDLVLLLEDLNSEVCRQSVQQEIVLSDRVPQEQVRMLAQRLNPSTDSQDQKRLNDLKR